MDRRPQPGRFGPRDDEYDRRGSNSQQRSSGRDRSPGRGGGGGRSPARRSRSPGRRRSPLGRVRSRSPGRGRSPRGRSPRGSGRTPVRDRSPIRNRSPMRNFTGGPGRNDLPASGRSRPDAFRGESFGERPMNMSPCPAPEPYSRRGDLRMPDRPGEPRSYMDRPSDARPLLDRPGEPRSYMDRPDDTRSSMDRPGEPRMFVDRPGDMRPPMDRPGEPRMFVDRPGDMRPPMDRPGEPRMFVDRPGDMRPMMERPGEPRMFVDRPGDMRPPMDRPGDGQSLLGEPPVGVDRLDRRPIMPPELMPTKPQMSDPSAVAHCELIIININDRLRMYGENVRMRLAKFGIVTELVLVREAIAVIAAVQDAVRRRVLFACIINEQNEMHRSVTVNILHGQLQEHRNMPLESAISLITRSFEEWAGGSSGEPSRPPPAIPGPRGGSSGPAASAAAAMPAPAAAAVPVKVMPTPEFKLPSDTLKRMLQMVIDGQNLVVEELDEIIAYLQERRDQIAKERGIAPIKPKSSETTNSSTSSNVAELQRKQLQDKIIKMLEDDPSLAKVAKGMLDAPGLDATTAVPRASQGMLAHQRENNPPQKSILGAYKDESTWGKAPQIDQSSYGARGYGQMEPPPQRGVTEYSSADLRGLQDKIRTLFPGSQPSPSMATPDAREAAPPQRQYPYPPAAGGAGNYGAESQNPDWRTGPGTAGPMATNGRQDDWRSSAGYGPPPDGSQQPNYRNPPPPVVQQYPPQNYRQQEGGRPEGGRQFSRFN